MIKQCSPAGLHHSTINQPKDKHMDDFEAGAVIFLLIIVFGIAGYLAASFFQ
jgi:hypothetical protein